jgi:von Willebrand factor type A domain
VAVVVPIVAFFVFERRADRVRRILRLPEPPSRARTFILVSITLIGAALGIAAAQPVLTRSTPRALRTDAEVYAVFDNSRSMLARRLGGASRFQRAKTIAERVRAELPDVPFGVASFAIFVLPHLFPTGDPAVFNAVVHDAVRIGSPPSPNVFAPNERTTDLSALSSMSDAFFDHSATRRLVIVFTDGESDKFFAGDVAIAFHHPFIHTIFVQVWDPRERIYLPGGKEDPGYRPDPSSRSQLAAIATATHGDVFPERAVGAIVSRARADLASGPVKHLAPEPGRTPLAPWVLGIAFVPLAFILRRRNL